jgi:hypothetical protein
MSSTIAIACTRRRSTNDWILGKVMAEPAGARQGR